MRRLLERVAPPVAALALAVMLGACQQSAPVSGTPIGQRPSHATTTAGTTHTAARPTHTPPASLDVCPPLVTKGDLLGISPPMPNSVINTSTTATTSFGNVNVWTHLEVNGSRLVAQGQLRQTLGYKCQVTGICQGVAAQPYAQIVLRLKGGRISTDKKGVITKVYVGKINLGTSTLLYACDLTKQGIS